MSDLETGDLPANEDTRADIKCFIEKIHRDAIEIVNGTGAVISQGDFVVAGNTGGASGQKVFCGVARQDIAIGANGVIDIEEGLYIQVDDLVSGEDTFATYGQNIFFDASAGEFSDTSTAGYFLVGLLTDVKSADGVIKFEKFRYGELI